MTMPSPCLFRSPNGRSVRRSRGGRGPSPRTPAAEASPGQRVSQWSPAGPLGSSGLVHLDLDGYYLQAMDDDNATFHDLATSVAAARFRILRVEGEEEADRSWQRVTCHLHREDLPWAAVPIAHAVSAHSFADARPRGVSGADFDPRDEWGLGDLLSRLRFERGRLVLETDYVRGRMMKTDISIGPDGRLVVATRNRHEMALRWLRALKGKRHLQLV